MVDAATALETENDALLDIRNLSIRYGDKVALKNVNFQVRRNEIFGIIGPANAGKTSFLRSLNRMDEFVNNMKVDGDIYFAGRDLTTVRKLYALRRMIGGILPSMVNQAAYPYARQIPSNAKAIQRSNAIGFPRILIGNKGAGRNPAPMWAPYRKPSFFIKSPMTFS